MTAQRSFIPDFAPRSRSLFSAAVLFTALVPLSRPALADDFVKPTAEELSMTSLPGYPGAPAVVLFREEITKDDLHSVSHYERIKILTEEGKKYANVELSYYSSTGDYVSYGDDKVVEDISGRTIHPDGTIIPFTGKPYLKVLEKGNGYKVQEKIFTLPDVEVGSIIEYRYYTRFSDNIVEPPTWMIQDDNFVKQAHFAWWPTTRNLVDEDEKPINSITWFPVLPQNAKLETHEYPASALKAPSSEYEIHVKDVPPRIREEFMPPVASFSYRVNFAFTPYRTSDEYWRSVGKQWSKHINSFAGPNSDLRDITTKVIAGAATPEEKLHKIYATVMNIQNTEFTREHEKREDKAAGLGEVKNAADVFTHERGTPTQLTCLFVGMARAAGLNASAMWVSDRSRTIFLSQWLNKYQLTDVIAVVNLNGKDVFFDPGSRYMPFGQLAWQHTGVAGIRQTDGGTTLAQTAIESYKLNHVSRVANLTMNPEGELTGKIDFTYAGAPALHWRQAALKGDDESLHKQLQQRAEETLPRTLDLEVADIKNLTDYEKPLVVSFKVKGTLGNSVGKRVMLPADLFLANAKATFPHDKRDLAVYFNYPEMMQDAVRINLPQNMAIEAVPSKAQYTMSGQGAYSLDVTQTPSNFTARRDFIFNDILVIPKDYANLRQFYSQFETKDQESVVLKAAGSVTASSDSPSQPGK